MSDEDGRGSLVARTRERRRGRAFPKLGGFRTTMPAARPSYPEHRPVAAAAAAASFSGLPQARFTYRTVVGPFFILLKAYWSVGRPDMESVIFSEGNRTHAIFSHHVVDWSLK